MFVCVLSGWLCRWLIAAGKRPVPFRTRKLSLRRADGTALGRVWESRLLPTLYNFIFVCLFGPWLGALWWCAWFTGHKHIYTQFVELIFRGVLAELLYVP